MIGTMKGKNKEIIMSSIKILEKALFKMVGTDWSVIDDQERFDGIVKSLFDKKQVKVGIKDYLTSHASGPNIMSVLLYSKRGLELLEELIEEKGIPNSRLYDPLIFDGASTIGLTQRFPLRDKIVDGGPEWHFDAHDWFDKVERITAFPGVIDAMVNRYRKMGRMDQVVRHMKVRTIADLIEHEPGIFAVELEGINKEMLDLVNEDNRYRDLTVCLVRTHLDTNEAISKILGSKPKVVD